MFNKVSNYLLSLIAACVSSMYGRGIYPCHHNFCGVFPFSFDFAVKWIVGIAIEPQISIKPVLGHHDFGGESFNDGFRHILPFLPVGASCLFSPRRFPGPLHNLPGHYRGNPSTSHASFACTCEHSGCISCGRRSVRWACRRMSIRLFASYINAFLNR